MQYTKDIGNYFRRNIGSHLHYRYGMCNLATEVMCLSNIVSIIFILQFFLKTFLQYLPHLLLHHLVHPSLFLPRRDCSPS